MYPRSGGFGLIAQACNVQATEASTLNRGSLGVDENDFSVGIVTLLNPIIGYEESSSIAKEALNENKSVYEIAVKERKIITQEKWDELFRVENLINPQFIL